MGDVHRTAPFPGSMRGRLGLADQPPGTHSGRRKLGIDAHFLSPQQRLFGEMSFEFTMSMGKELPGLAFKNKIVK